MAVLKVLISQIPASCPPAKLGDDGFEKFPALPAGGDAPLVGQLAWALPDATTEREPLLAEEDFALDTPESDTAPYYEVTRGEMYTLLSQALAG